MADVGMLRDAMRRLAGAVCAITTAGAHGKDRFTVLARCGAMRIEIMGQHPGKPLWTYENRVLCCSSRTVESMRVLFVEL